jgi:hypothetical protein
LKPRQILLCGLDYSGKTTMIKRFQFQGGNGTEANSYSDDVSDIVMTTAFLGVERINLPGT